MTAYETLMSYVRKTEALSEIAGRLGWDQETMMPRGAAGQRAEEMAAMEDVLHARRIAPEVAEGLEAARAGTPAEAANLREIRRAYDRAGKVPADLAAAIARTTSIAQGIWAEARANEDVGAFLPILKEVLNLRRQEAHALASGGDLYDALLDDYEPGATSARLSEMFDTMRPRLVGLRAAILERPAPPELTGAWAEADQLAVSTKLADVFGYDRDHGRLDKAVHPFSSGSGLDVRITTRTSLTDPFNCFYSTIHEVGHATYEQNVSQDYLLTPIGSGASMGVHESQSRIYENQLGRSRAFTGWLLHEMTRQFGRAPAPDAEGFYATANRVSKGYIRTEADEVQYNLHILLRFDLEQALVRGDLEAADLEAAWNDRFERDFGYAVDTPSNGCLQDVHWSVGLFGYFPTYALGNVYSGCLHAALRRDLPDLDEALAQGDPSPATRWLADRLQRHGMLRSPRDTIAEACGHDPHEGPILDYLDEKFGALYDL